MTQRGSLFIGVVIVQSGRDPFHQFERTQAASCF